MSTVASVKEELDSMLVNLKDTIEKYAAISASEQDKQMRKEGFDRGWKEALEHIKDPSSQKAKIYTGEKDD